MPVWLLAMVLAILPVWLVWPGPQGALLGELGLLVFAPFGLGVLLLALTPFGQELNWGTFPVLLAQPVSRQRLWVVKTVVAAVALVLAFIAFNLSTHFRVASTLESMKHTVWRNAFEVPNEHTAYFTQFIVDTKRAATRDSLLIGGLEVLAGFAGGLWTTLLFRQVTAAFWLTWLVPMGLALLAGSLFKSLPDAMSRAGLALILGAYSAAGYLWAKRFFLQVQDTQWTGGVVALPAWGGSAAGKTSISGRRQRKPLRALVRKELQAQQVNVLLAGGLLFVHLVVIALRRWGAEYMATHVSVAMTLEMVPLLWLAMPLLIGSVAVAEERKLGMFQATLCLPSSRRVQFLVKLFVALFLGFVLGGVLPLLVEALAPPTRTGGSFNTLAFLGDLRSTLFLQLAGSLILTFLAFYGSTLTRNALQGMGAGLLGAVLVCLLVVAALAAGNSAEFFLWRGPLIGLIGIPVLLLVLSLLAYRNYGKLQPDARVWFSNGLSLFAALFGVAAITSTVYHRAWEAWLPEEPPHGFDRIGLNIAATQWMPRSGHHATRKVLKNRVDTKIIATGAQRAVLLPDGRLWVQQRPARLMSQAGDRQQYSVARYALGPQQTGFIPGSDWADVAIIQGACVALKADGSLWDVSPSGSNGTGPAMLGQGNDWTSVSGAGGHFSAIKSDGTLWQWGWEQNQAETRLSTPRQVGSDTDWVAVCDDWNQSAAIKQDGNVWSWDWRPRHPAIPQPWLEGACAEPVSLSLRTRVLAAVCGDGTLWIGGDLTNSVYTRLVDPGRVPMARREMVRWGRDSDWRQIRFVSWGKAAGVKRDGTLWEWDVDFSYGPMRGWVVTPTLSSRYEDWLAVGDDDNAYLALASDGSLCLWGNLQNPGYRQWDGLPPANLLLMPSRIKATRLAELAR